MRGNGKPREGSNQGISQAEKPGDLPGEETLETSRGGGEAWGSRGANVLEHRGASGGTWGVSLGVSSERA